MGSHNDNDREDDREDAVSLHPLLVSIAYGMTGEVHIAEDPAQEALARVEAASRDVEIASPKAHAAAVVTRLAIDRSRSEKLRHLNCGWSTPS
jgi:DNA-directed RNA polymerase specialized sigma24 family protein